MKNKLLYTFFFFITIIGLYSCTRQTNAPYPNLSPETTTANIPKQNDTLFALLTLHWNGGDNDGFVAGFEYRYFTYHFNQSEAAWKLYDSINWQRTDQTSLTIAFNSSDVLNRQRFLVRAVDNNGAVDPTPAEKIFYTTQSVPPRTKILSPSNNSKLLAIEKVTDWWPGVFLSFKAEDPEQFGKVIEYAWSVDNGSWTWGKDTALYIEPKQFKQPFEGVHIIRVTSRDNTNLIDPVGDSVRITLTIPSFAKSILIIDETDEFNTPFVGNNWSDEYVDSYYSELFPNSDSWDYLKQGMPTREFLAQYKLVVWHADDLPSTKPHKLSLQSNIDIIKDYLNIGGKFLMSGWRILKSFAFNNNFPFDFSKGSFVYDYLHIREVDETILWGDCTGAVGVGSSFGDIRVDTMKIADFPFNGKLAQVNIIPGRGGFTDILYSYQNADDSPYYKYRGRACGLRYYGTSFDAVVLGFPMFFINKDDAKVMAKEILSSLKIN